MANRRIARLEIEASTRVPSEHAMLYCQVRLICVETSQERVVRDNALADEPVVLKTADPASLVVRDRTSANRGAGIRAVNPDAVSGGHTASTHRTIDYRWAGADTVDPGPPRGGAVHDGETLQQGCAGLAGMKVECAAAPLTVDHAVLRTVLAADGDS